MAAKPQDITGTVTWSSNTGCSPSTVSGYPGIATCTTSRASSLPVGSDTVTATYSGDANHSGSMGSVIQQVTGNIATSINVTSVAPSSEDYGSDYASYDHGSVVVDRQRRCPHGERCDH